MTLLKRTLFYFLPPAAILLLVSITLFAAKRNVEWTMMKAKEADTLAQQRGVIDSSLRSVVSDLYVLAAHYELQQLLASGDDRHRHHLAQEFLAFADYKQTYDQIRFLDERGMEIIRVNFNDQRPSIVADKDLQDKSQRYYFRDTYRLNNKQIFISPFDLNIEFEAIEKPRKPMLRFGTPVFDDLGRKRGVIILNYLGQKLLDHLENVTHGIPGRTMLLNSDGFWLKGIQPADEWGFMYQDRRQLTFGHRFPDEWQRIRATEADQFTDDHGLFTHATIFPLLEGAISSTTSDQTPETTQGTVSRREYFWKLVSWVEPTALLAETRAFAWQMAQIDLLLSLLMGYGALLIAKNDLSRRQAERELAFEAKYNRVVAELSTLLLAADSVDQISSVLLAKARELTASQHGLVGFVDQESGNLKVACLTEGVMEQCRMTPPQTLTLHKGEGMFGWMFDQQDAFYTNEPANHHHFRGVPAGHIAIRRLLAAPAFYEGRLIGQLVLANADRDYGDHDLEVVRHLASLYALAVKQQWAEDRITELALYDQLTGLVNRHCYNDRLLQAANQAKRHGRKAALLFIDLDHFKPINDTLGHQAGDAVLKEVAQRIKSLVRATDTVARLGGDEFAVIILDLAAPQEVGTVAAKILQQLAAPIPLPDAQCTVGGSIGISLFPDDADTIELWQHRADEAMYRVKRDGRNAFAFFAGA